MGTLYLAYSLAQLSTIAFQASKLIDYVYELEKLVDDYAGNVLFSIPGAVLILVVCVFQTKPATDSRRNLPPIPRECCH